MNILELYPDHIRIDPINNCWLWQYPMHSDGYGQVHYNSQNIMTHRLSAHLSLELDLNDRTIQVNHKRECSNKNCCNFAHLYLGSGSENIIDSYVNGRIPWNLLKTHCPSGHEYNKENTYLDGKGYRRCRICAKENRKMFRLLNNR